MFSVFAARIYDKRKLKFSARKEIYFLLRKTNEGRNFLFSLNLVNIESFSESFRFNFKMFKISELHSSCYNFLASSFPNVFFKATTDRKLLFGI